jgi:hypothetical protein
MLVLSLEDRKINLHQKYETSLIFWVFGGWVFRNKFFHRHKGHKFHFSKKKNNNNNKENTLPLMSI